MGKKKPAKSLPTNIAKRFKAKRRKDAEDEERWAAIDAKKEVKASEDKIAKKVVSFVNLERRKAIEKKKASKGKDGQDGEDDSDSEDVDEFTDDGAKYYSRREEKEEDSATL